MSETTWGLREQALSVLIDIRRAFEEDDLEPGRIEILSEAIDVVLTAPEAVHLIATNAAFQEDDEEAKP